MVMHPSSSSLSSMSSSLRVEDLRWDAVYTTFSNSSLVILDSFKIALKVPLGNSLI